VQAPCNRGEGEFLIAIGPNKSPINELPLFVDYDHQTDFGFRCELPPAQQDAVVRQDYCPAKQALRCPADTLVASIPILPLRHSVGIDARGPRRTGVARHNKATVWHFDNWMRCSADCARVRAAFPLRTRW